MPAYTTWLAHRREIAAGTIELALQRPNGFHFEAGQYVDLTLIDPPQHDIFGDSRTFSIASAPFQEELLVVMRMGESAFKQVLCAAPLGAELKLEGPAGAFALHSDANRPAVFLAGGVGIAPFLSILRQAYHRRAAHRFYLFYSNRRPKEIAYLDELRNLEAREPSFRLVLTVTGTATSDMQWSGETGHINQAMLRRYLPDLKHPVYYVAGPSRFISGMRSLLTVTDIEEADIRIEDFGEY